MSNIARKVSDQLKQFHSWSALAKEQSGKSVLTQIQEIRALRDMGGQCGISDYYWYKLYDDNYQFGRGARDFLGWRLETRFNMALNPRHAVLPAWDKLAFLALGMAAGLPVAPVRAYYHRAKVLADGDGEHLNTVAAVGAFLRTDAAYPLFTKPAFSQQGKGSQYLSGYDRAGDALMLPSGATIAVDEFLQRLTVSIDSRYHRPECGFVFQQPLLPSSDIRALTDWSAICGVRVTCLNGPEGAKPILAQWKIALPPHHVDNFSMVKYGNLIANVDVNTGRVTKALKGFWPNTEVQRTNASNGALLEGFELPGWDKVLAACRQGGAAFPLMQIHHWDFALTDKGPVILELNDLGGTIASQIHGRGILTEEVRAFLRRHAHPSARSWVEAL